MAKKSMILKQQAEPKFSTRRYNRCKICGRPHAYLRDYGVCRICFRELAYKGQIPGVRKASLVKDPRRAALCPGRSAPPRPARRRFRPRKGRVRDTVRREAFGDTGWRKVTVNYADRARPAAPNSQ